MRSVRKKLLLKSGWPNTQGAANLMDMTTGKLFTSAASDVERLTMSDHIYWLSLPMNGAFLQSNLDIELHAWVLTIGNSYINYPKELPLQVTIPDTLWEAVMVEYSFKTLTNGT